MKRMEEELLQMREERLGLEDAGVQKQKLLRDKEVLAERERDLQEAEETLSELKRVNEAYERAKSDYRAAAESAEAARQNAKQLRKAFNDEQAGMMAAGLEDGRPCPVCGSVHHPAKAVMTENAPTEAEVEWAEERAQTAQNEENDKSSAAGQLKASAEHTAQIAGKQLARLFDGCGLAEAPARIGEWKSGLASQNRALDELIREEGKRESRKQQLDRLIPEQETKRAECDRAVSEKRETLAAEQSALQETLQQAEQLTGSLKYADKKAAQAALSQLLLAAGELKSARETAEKNLRDQELRLTELKARSEQLRRLIADAEAPDRPELERQREELGRQKAVLVQRQKVIHARLVSNRGALANIREKSAQLTELDEKWQWMNALSNTANGRIKGIDHVALETYVQMTYFDRIVARANTHLMHMSGGKYDLKRRENAENKSAQSGLELDVIDHYNGSERSVKSLSGGESFLASLSLALGMAEEVQASAGGIRLDTMFVDEGFGSLDEETLQQAMKALTGLTESNRLVGIISHVAELRERIDKQIVVRKEKTGGSRAEIRLG